MSRLSPQQKLHFFIQGNDISEAKRIIYRSDNYNFDYSDAFAVACASGNREIAEWIIKTFPRNPYNYTYALECACEANQLEMMIWVYESFSNVHNFNFVRLIDKIFHVDTARWLLELRPDYIGTLINIACRNGNKDLMEFYIDNYHYKGNYQLLLVCLSENGHISVAKWLRKKVNYPFDLTDPKLKLKVVPFKYKPLLLLAKFFNVPDYQPKEQVLPYNV